MHALRRVRPVRRLLPHIIQLEIAIVLAEGPLATALPPTRERLVLRVLLHLLTLLNCRGRAAPARRLFSRCVCGRRASPARRDMSFSTASGSTERVSERTNERMSERTNERARITTNAGVQACAREWARAHAIAAYRRTSRCAGLEKVAPLDLASLPSKSSRRRRRRRRGQGEGARRRENEDDDGDDGGVNGGEISWRHARFRRSPLSRFRLAEAPAASVWL